eukprot:TRINITY_DN6673_c0_g1_i4.p1 TRINITY_DN6673_c0_g1~~TRINITY_DN6673_c0_g1_i4.p1  ORF type:complete len:181 (+),score=36.77 TRINITY_DN6673_c0_g1_i4:59-601(+)
MYQRTARKVTEVVFPSSRVLLQKTDDNPAIFSGHVEVLSSLPLQSLVYFNCLLSLTWFSIGIPLLQWKRDNLFRGLTVLPYMGFAIWCIFEPLRLYSGYVGNLKEKVPHLVVFFILTLFPVFETIVYFVSIQRRLLPFDVAINSIYLCFLIPEIFFGFQVIHRLIKAQSARFHIPDAPSV